MDQSSIWSEPLQSLFPASLPGMLGCDHWLALKEMRPSRSRSASSITARMSSSLTCSRLAIKPEDLGIARHGYI